MLHLHVQDRVHAALLAVLPALSPSVLATVLVRPAPDSKFGDLQCNALMSVAKGQSLNPRQLATQVVAQLDLTDVCTSVEVAGAGFLNFRLQPAAIAHVIAAAAAGQHLFFTTANLPRTVVIDFSSPNVAKPMHVGHIRSTGIGDALQRTFRLLGHRVITDNHIGDWGTQFGKLLLGWQRHRDEAALVADPIAELERLYREINAACDADPTILEAARQELVKLQQGDAANLKVWQEMIRLSQVQFDAVYGRLGIHFDYTLGESFYNPQLGEVVTDLLKQGVARESAGAVAVFSERSAALAPKDDPLLVQKDGEWVDAPALIRKSDGGFNYTTTDLATLAYRLQTWAPNEILYIVDDRQAGHFRSLFHVFNRWQPGATNSTRLRHIGFGKILGEDGKPFKTRSGATIKLSDLLDEAVERALLVVVNKRPELPVAQQREIARIVGLGAVKWQDLLPNRESDYQFSWDKMLALQGNTSVYVQYQYTRAAKVLRDSGVTGSVASRGVTLELIEPAELMLAKHFLKFGVTLEKVVEECRPNFLSNYLYELATQFSRFYDQCPVLKPEIVGVTRMTRLVLCDLTAKVLREGLECLGIEVSETM